MPIVRLFELSYKSEGNPLVARLLFCIPKYKYAYPIHAFNALTKKYIKFGRLPFANTFILYQLLTKAIFSKHIIYFTHRYTSICNLSSLLYHQLYNLYAGPVILLKYSRYSYNKNTNLNRRNFARIIKMILFNKACGSKFKTITISY